MTYKNTRTILIGIPCVISLVGVFVMIGWFTGSETLIRIHPDLSSLKFIGAFLFFLCGFELLCLVKILIDKDTYFYRSLLILSTISICTILLCMAVALSPDIAPLLDVIPAEKVYDTWTRIPYIPSFLALFVILLVSLVPLFMLYSPQRVPKVISYFGGALVFLGILALLRNILRMNGVIIDLKISSGVSLHTAILVSLIGIFYYVLSRQLKKSGN